jgi:hypothetical protein
MTNRVWRACGLAILLMLVCRVSTAEERTPSLTLPITGSGGFRGAATINKFEHRGNGIVAIGVVRDSSGTAFTGVAWPVTVTAEAGSLSAKRGQSRGPGELMAVVWSPRRQNGLSKLLPVQTTTSCGVLNISLGAVAINLAGVQVSLNLITLSISGQPGTPLGSLVCSALNLLENVAGLVNVLNRLLGSLTGVGAAPGGILP